MVHPFLLSAYLTVQVAMVYSQFQDVYYNDNNHMVIGNLRRREVRPLNPYFSPYSRRRYGADAQTILNYRRTRDIRDKENVADRRFELSEAQLREEKLNNIENLENIHNELRWLSIDDEEGIANTSIQKHEYPTTLTVANMRQMSFRRNMTFWIPVKKNKVNVAKPKSQKSITTFSEALRATVIIGQIFSLLPFVGVFTNIASNVKFVKTSWKCVYSLLSLIGQMFIAVLCINKLARSNVTLTSTSHVIFYVTTCVTMSMFFQVARRWPRLVQHIAKAEEMDPNIDRSLTRKCNITCTVVLILATIEHILSLLAAFAGASACFSELETYEGFLKHFYPWVFNYLPYSIVLGVITQFLHFQATFIWNFSDLFVICMSYYLTSRLDQVNKKLLAAQGKYLPEIFWRVTREDYCRATQIVRKVDGVISGVVFIAFANNLFFICLQLFNTLEDGLKGTGECIGNKAKKIIVSKSGPLGGHETATYFLFSLVYLLSRSVAVSLIASQVNSASAVPAPVLYDVPSPVYCVEVQRFLDQVNGDKVALTGLQFFSVTRGLLLTVAGTIVTYELVMFQFNSSSTPTLNITSPAIAPTLSTTTLTS